MTESNYNRIEEIHQHLINLNEATKSQLKIMKIQVLKNLQ
jgi:hypothetical protein